MRPFWRRSPPSAEIPPPPAEPETREPTAEERARFERMLLGHDVEGAQLIALGYALRLTRGSRPDAWELVRRARTRMWQNASWDPARGPKLSTFLCGQVRSEHHKDVEQAEARAEHAELMAGEASALGEDREPSAEERAVELEEQREARATATARLEVLRARFVAAGDEVNLVWLDLALEGVTEPAEMARRAGRDVTEFYRAADRRKRHVQRMLAEGPARRDPEEER